MSSEVASLPKAPRPIRLPQIVLLLGSHTLELAEALLATNEEFAITSLHKHGYELAGFVLGGDPAAPTELVVEGILACDFAASFERFMGENLGLDWAAVAFIKHFDNESEPNESVLIDDATIHDIEPFVKRFGGENVLLINCGALSMASSLVKTVWLPSENLAERMSLLRRELGED